MAGRDSYTAYIDKLGRRVKAGSRGAKPIQIRINREALRKASQSAGRIGGKFAPRAEAVKHAKRRKAAAKGKATRQLNKLAILKGERFTTLRGFIFQEYYVPFNHEAEYQAIVDRESLEGAAYFYVTVGYSDSEGDSAGFRTNNFEMTERGVKRAVESVEELIGQYNVEVIEEIIVKVSYPLTQPK